MIVCLCRGVSESSVKRVIGAGALTLDDVVDACSAGSDCGACQDMLLELLEAAHARRACASARGENAAAPVGALT